MNFVEIYLSDIGSHPSVTTSTVKLHGLRSRSLLDSSIEIGNRISNQIRFLPLKFYRSAPGVLLESIKNCCDSRGMTIPGGDESCAEEEFFLRALPSQPTLLRDFFGYDLK